MGRSLHNVHSTEVFDMSTTHFILLSPAALEYCEDSAPQTRPLTLFDSRQAPTKLDDVLVRHYING